MSNPATLSEALAEIDRLTKLVDVLQECLHEPPSHSAPSREQERVDHEESARVLRELVNGTDPSKGEEFFPSLVRHLAAALNTKYAVVWTFANDRRDRMKSLAVWAGDRLAENFEGPIPGTPCARTVAERGFCAFPERIRQQFPDVEILTQLSIESYFAAPLFGREGRVIGNLVIMHDEPRRLTPSQQTILEAFAARAGAELGRQIAERDLARSEAYYRALIEQALDIVTVVSPDGFVRYQSPSLQRIMGWNPEERIGQDAFEYLHPDDQAAGRAIFQEVLQHPGSIRRCEFRFRHQDGFWRILEAVGRATTELQAGLSVIVNMRDVTERRRAEEALQRERRHLVEAQALAHLGSWEWDIESGDELWSDEQYRIFGQEPNSIRVTYDTFLAALHPEDHDRTLGEVNRALLGEKPYDAECRIVRPSGEVRTLHCRGTVVRNAAGHPVRMEGTVLDITERKQTEEALRTSEERWHLAVRGSNDGIWDWDIRTGEVFFSSRWKAMRGFEEQELPNALDEWRSRIHPDDLERVLQRLDLYLAKGSEEFCEEYRVLHKDGSYRWVLDRGLAVWGEDGQALRMAGSESDITDRKLAERALRQSEERYRMLVDHSPSGVFVYEGGKTVYVNQAACRILGASSPEEILRRSAFDLIHPDDRATAEDRTRKLLETGAALSRMELRYVALDGRVLDVEVAGGLVTWNGNPAIQGIFIDITERKKAEASLREMNIALTQAMPGIARIDGQGLYCEVNANYARMLGCKPADLVGQSWEPTEYPEDRSLAFLAYERMLADGKGEFEARAVRKDGSTFFKHVLMVKGLDGGPAGHHCFMRDITERKEAEAKSERDRRRLELQIAEMPVGYIAWDREFRVISWNPAAERIFGYSAGEAVGRHASFIVPADLRGQVETIWSRLLSGDRAAHSENDNLTKDGRRITCQWTNTPLSLADGTTRAFSMVVDVTERKRADETLRQSEELFSKAFRSSPDPMVLTDVESGLWLDVNDACAAGLGYSREQLIGRRGEEVGHWVNAAERAQFLDRLKQSGSIRNLEASFKTADGEVRDCLVSAEFIEYHGKRCMVTLSKDITERKRAEARLRENEQHLITAQALAHLGSWSWDIATGVNTWSNENYRIFGFEPGAVVPNYELFTSALHEQDRDRVLGAVQEALAENAPYDVECRIVRPAGEIRYVHCRGDVMRDADGRPLRMAGTVLDVTERKRAEQALRESEERFAKAFRSSPNPIGITDVETGCCIDVNDACLELFGFHRAEVVGHTTLVLGIWPDASDRAKLLAELHAHGAVRNRELSFLTRTGQLRHILLSSDLIELNERPCMITVGNDITERKAAEEALRVSEEFNRVVLDSLSAHIAVLDRAGTIVAVNRAWKAFGFENAPSGACGLAVGTNYLRVCEDASKGSLDATATLDGIKEVLSGNRDIFEQEYACETPNGELWFAMRVTPLTQGEGGAVVAHENITERKRAEEALRMSEDRYHRATAVGKVGVWELDVAQARYVADTNLKTMFGYGPDELSTDPYDWLKLVYAEDQPTALTAWERIVSGETDEYAYQIRMCRKDGSILWTDVRGHAVRNGNGQVQRLIGATMDVTDRYRAQRDLERSERQLRTVLDTLPIGVWFTDRTGRPVLANPASQSIWSGVKQVGCDATAEGKGWWELFTSTEQPHRWALGPVLAKGEPCLNETLELECLDGTRRTIRNSAVPVRDEQGNVSGALVLNEDITERIKAEEALRQNHALLSAIMDASVDLIYVKDLQGRYVHMNQAGAKILGMRVDDIVGWEDVALWGAELAASCHAADQEVLESGRTVTVEECDRAHGAPVYYLTTKAPYRDPEGRIIGVIGVSRDITERKQAELERERRYAELHAIFGLTLALSRASTVDEIYERALDGVEQALKTHRASILLFDEQGTARFQAWRGISEGYRRAVDGHCPWTPEAKDPQPILVPDVSRDPSLDPYRQRFQEEGIRALAFIPLMSPGGLLGKFMVYYDQPHQFTDHEIGVVRTIAGHVAYSIQRTKDQQALRASEERYRLLVEEAPIGIFVNEGGKFSYVNRELRRILKAERPEDLIGTPVFTRIAPEFHQTVRDRIQLLLQKREPAPQLEEQYLRMDGSRVDVSVTAIPAPVGAAGALLVLVLDNSEKKRAEEALKVSEHRFAKAFRASLHPVVIGELETGLVVEANEAAYRIFGYSREEVAGRTTLQIGLWPSAEERARFVDLLKREGSVRNLEVKLRTKDGAFRQCILSSELIELDGKQCMVTVGNDITDRKRAEEELRRSHAFLRQVIDIDPNFIFAKDREGRFRLVNKAVADAYGTTVEDLTGRTDADFNPNQEQVEFFRRKDLEVMDSLQERFIPEEVITDAQGRTRWLQTVKRPILDGSGCATMVLGAATDITERKRMEEELRQQERDLRAALEERERISQDLHDGILQSLYAMGLSLETCRPLLKKLRAKTITGTLDRVVGQLNEIMGDVRAFIAGLETELWHKQDLAMAIRTMVQTLAQPHERRCRVLIDTSASRALTPEQGMHLFRIAKEALSNSLRHAKATSTVVSLRQVKQGIRLTISDNGIGFNPSKAAGVGHGLANMASRAARVGGTLNVHAKPKQGTRIVLDIPKEIAHA